MLEADKICRVHKDITELLLLLFFLPIISFLFTMLAEKMDSIR